jgi:predicted exporter
LAVAYGAFSLLPLDSIDTDPFLLAGRRMEEFLSSSLLPAGAPSGRLLNLKENVLAAYMDGAWHILFRITFKPEAVSISGKGNAAREIYAAAQKIKEAVPGSEFYFSGIPFHSYESSSGAQKEISLISSVTLVIILAIFLFVFRSPLPVMLSLFAVFISLGMALGTALLVFREIHVITFVFGTTLIGTCVDYSIHFFMHWKGNLQLKNGYEIRKSISKSIIMSFISTEICFFIFLFAPFLILKQFALFCMAGLLSSFLTSYCLYPLLKMPANKKNEFKIFTIGFAAKIIKFMQGVRVKYFFFAAFTASVLTIVVLNQENIRIKNDITSLYTMPPPLMESEKLSSRIMNRSGAPWYFIVSGESPDKTIENEEILIQRLDEENASGNPGAFLAVSALVPSIGRQQKTYAAMKALLPLAATLYGQLGFPPGEEEVFCDEYAAGERYCRPDDAPEILGLANLWIGKAGDKYYSCVLSLQGGDEAAFKSIAEELDFVFFINKAHDISRNLDTITGTMLFLFLVSFIVISVLVFLVYPRSESIKICMVPVFIFISILAVLLVNKIPFNFFSAAGITLVFGLGLDYIFYICGRGHDEKGISILAVLLSFLTTILSFGALALSSFVPVHLFGLTVSAGLAAAFISAMLLTGKKY